ncbi:MAG: peroxiredoxin family protein [Bacteroidota bacterium]|jgi:peroxiredoxin|nr:TlpA family protein disulfide reductase [Flammeovirgaceae bacterium]MCZ8069031.1 TlpA disulfide reductase family protein [Cytophagales bacterium]
MRLALILLFSFSILANCSPEKKTDNAEANAWIVTVRGKVTNPVNGASISVQELKQDGTGVLQTIALKAGNTYEAKLNLTSPGYYQFNFFNRQRLNIMVNKSDIELNVDGSNQQGFWEIKGSPDHDLINRVQAMVQESQAGPAMQAIESEFQQAVQAKNEKRIAELQSQAMTLMDNNTLKLVAFLKEQPVSLGLFNVLQDPNLIDKDKYIDLFISSAEKFKREWPTYSYTKELNNQVEKLKVTAVGQIAPEISLANPSGEIVKLSSLRGKYVLIDFWAKWCGPCRRENPNVVKAYKRFKDKGFEVFGVSLDRNKEDWVKAIAEDGLTWTHVSDLKYFESQAAKDYNINAIPFSILLDKSGKIIAKNLRGAALEKKLEEVIN